MLVKKAWLSVGTCVPRTVVSDQYGSYLHLVAGIQCQAVQKVDKTLKFLDMSLSHRHIYKWTDYLWRQPLTSTLPYLKPWSQLTGAAILAGVHSALDFPNMQE